VQRYINLSSVIYFSIIVLCSWEGMAITFQFALLNGGPAALIYGCFIVGFGGIAVAYSMAEMASM
jgi:choline transport protein